MARLTHVSIFSGIGGFDLAAEWAGFETVLHVEIDSFCQKILKKHWPGVRLIGDIRDVNERTIADLAEWQNNERERRDVAEETTGRKGGNAASGTGNSTAPHSSELFRQSSGAQQGEWPLGHGHNQGISLLTGGPPCQPASVAGKRLGAADDRWLWGEALRVVRLLKPNWVCFENPVGIVSLGKSGETPDVADGAPGSLPPDYAAALDGICSEIEDCGYECVPVSIPACAVGAPHRRERIFIVAHHRGAGQPRASVSVFGEGQDKDLDIGGADSALPESRLQGRGEYGECSGERHATSCYWQEHWLSAVARLCRVDDGLPRGVDRTNRLKALGNAVVPQQCYPILKAIADYERKQK